MNQESNTWGGYNEELGIEKDVERFDRAGEQV